MPFCTNCGKPVKEQFKFCQSCGMPVEPPVKVDSSSPSPAPPAVAPVVQNVQPPSPMNPVPAAPVSNELIRAVIPYLSLPKSFGRSDSYSLIVTDRRSIFARLTQNIMNETVKMARANAEAQGKGFFGKWAAQTKGFENYATWYSRFTPDQILRENQGNFAIENSMIRKIKVKDQSDFEDAARVQYEIEFQTVTEKLKFKTQYNLENQLKQVYGVAVGR